MNASEAREKALLFNVEKYSIEYSLVKENIQDAVNMGKFSSTYGGNISNYTAFKLNDEGFTVNRIQSGNNEYSWVIKW